MTQLFLVTRTRGPRWNDSRSLEEQEGWRAHADFMNSLESAGFVVLGGPVVGTRDALLVVRARHETEIHARLSGDPWTQNHMLQITSIRAWQLRLGSISSSASGR
jgi:hypothetical protein